MFRSVKLTRVTIQTPEEHISAVMAILGDLRLLHLIKVEETHLGRMGYVAKVDTSLLKRYDSLLNRVNRLHKDLHLLESSQNLSKTPRPDKAIFHLEEACASIEKKCLATLEQREEKSSALSEHEALIGRLQLLETAEIDLNRMRELHYVVWHAGLLPEKNLERLEMSLGEIHHHLISLDHRDKRTVLLAMALKEDDKVLQRALKSAFWDPLVLPEELNGKISNILQQLKAERDQIEKNLDQLTTKCHALSKKYGPELQKLREELLIARELLRAQAKFGLIDHTYLLSGWLPVSLFKNMRERILKTTSGKALIDKVDPEDIKEVRSGILSIPILFNNPALIRPFERLTNLYGTPSYDEVEPTGFLALSFLLLFGMMFGDVGHGAIICAVGYLVFKKMFRYFDYGIILMECGVSAMIFGVLYGSVFGLENLIPALWIHPMEEIGRFMKTAAFFGIGMISTGLVLNLVNMFRQHRYNELLSVSGLAGALLYWLAVGLGVRYFFTGTLSTTEILFAKISTAILFVLMILQRPIRLILSQHDSDKQTRLLPANLGITFLESFIEVLDELLRYLANTVSFVRIAAFALAHAGLFMAVFTLADMVRNAQGTGLLYWLTLILGNIVIIALEGLIVSIQTVRLEYYEFFSKFFRGGGKPFQPLFEDKKRQYK